MRTDEEIFEMWKALKYAELTTREKARLCDILEK